MIRRDLALWAVLSAGWLGTVSAASADQDTYTPTTTQPVEETSPPTSAPAEKAELPGPNYLMLRYNEDYTYLDGPPGSYKKDFFDPIKNIHLSQDWRLNIGGEIRQRWESETNKNFGARDPTQDAFHLQRLWLHMDLKYRDTLRAFFQGIDNSIYDRDLAQSPGQEDRFDIGQAFIDVKPFGDKTPLTLRGGRQEMSYGRLRVIDVADWGNTHRRFDGFKLMYQTPKLDVDFFWTHPVVFATKPFINTLRPPINEGMNRKLDHYREEQQFFGMYSTYKGIPRHQIDYYMLGLTDNGFLSNANGRMGDLTLYTIGGRFGGATGNFDYDVEGAGQWGKWAGDDVKAWMFATDEGYTLKRVPWTPRLGVGLDYASGDDTPRDGAHETYNQLFPSNHTYLGYLDLFGRQNLLAPNVNLTLQPFKDVTARLFYYHYWLPSNLDSAYNKTQGSARRNVSGSSGHDLGDEFDVTLSKQIDVHSAILVGWAHFWPGSFINTSGRSEDADLIFVQYSFKF
jgi:hypothetical protein